MRSNSWEDVSDLSASFGLVLDEWQETVLQAAMGERADGRWAARQVGLSAPRQNGKSQIIVARALAGILLFGEDMIMVSAHQQDTAREVFIKIVDILEETPKLDARVDSYGKATNREYIRFKARPGEIVKPTIRFKARSKSGGRGFSADCLILDEAQILAPAEWAAILPTVSARTNPQVWLMGTPPTAEDDGEVFGRIRSVGMAGKDSRLAYLEWSATPEDDIDDEAVWAKANPAYGLRGLDRESVLSERSALADSDFQMERLGMWAGSQVRRVIPAEFWSRQADMKSFGVDRYALGIEVAPDAERASVCLAAQREDGGWHVELDEAREGVDWVGPYVEAMLKANPQIRGVGADAGSPAKVIIEERRPREWFLIGTDVRVIVPKVQDLGAACTAVLSGVVSGELWHVDQGQLNVAVAAAGKRALGDTGMWVWSRSAATSDVTPVQALTLALFVAQLDKIWRKPLRTNSGKGKVVVM